MSASETPSDQVGTRVLFENDIVRVWDFTLRPGEVSQLHHHALDYFFIYVTDDNTLEVHVPGERPDPVATPDGYVSFTTVGSGADPRLTHRLANVGDHVHRQVLIELKHGAGREGVDAATTHTNQLTSGPTAGRTGSRRRRASPSS